MRQAGQVITERSTPDQSINDKGTFRQILGNKIVQLLAVYILVYVGIEVTIGGGRLDSFLYDIGLSDCSQAGLSLSLSMKGTVALRPATYLQVFSVVRTRAMGYINS